VTIVLGIAGALVAGFVGQLAGIYPAGHPAGFIMSVIGAVLAALRLPQAAASLSLGEGLALGERVIADS
jgi:uncharacterized membrane protein YeaQ/YmgE (transglycosylase-associated protein family)